MQPPSPDLLVIGASCRSAAAAAFEEGLKVAAIDLFCDSDMRSVVTECQLSTDFPHDLAKLASRYTRCPWIYVGGLENYPDVIRQICRQHRLLGNSADVVRRVRDPIGLSKVVPLPNVLKTPPDVADKLLLKPRRSCGGLGIRWLSDATDSSQLIASGSHYAQKFLPGTPMSSLYLADGNRSRLLATFQAIEVKSVERPFLYRGSIGPIPTDEAETKALAELGQSCVSEFSLLGLFGIDWMLDGGKRFVLEVNPRWTATVELAQLAFAWPLIGWHMSACQGHLLEVVPNANNSLGLIGKRILYARKDFQFNSLMLKQWAELFGEEDMAWRDMAWRDMAWRDLPEDGTRIGVGQPVCSLFATFAPSTDTTSVSEFLANCAAMIHEVE